MKSTRSFNLEGQAVEIQQLKENASRASALLKSMSNYYRLLVLCQLVEGERSVGQLERIVGLSQSALSQHLARLRRDKLVQTRRSAQTIFYSLSGVDARQVLETLHDLYCSKGEAAESSSSACAA